MAQHTVLQSLLENLKQAEIDLTQKGESLGSKSLFSAFQVLMNLGAHCSSPEFQKIMDISTKLTHVTDLIKFCETILQKMESNEQLDSNEQIFLEYISMVSQISGMTLELEEIQGLTNSKFRNYNQIIENLKKRISKRFDAFMNFMTFSLYHQRMVSCKKYPWITKSGSPSKTFRTITDEDWIEIGKKESFKNEETQRLSDECQGISCQKTQLLKRLSQLARLVLEVIQTFVLKSSPELSFFLSGFDPNHFVIFRTDFMSIDEIFQSLKTEIDAFNQNVESLTEKYVKEFEKPCEYLNNWNQAVNGGFCFYGKKD
jgi:hypothetical protein